MVNVFQLLAEGTGADGTELSALDRSDRRQTGELEQYLFSRHRIVSVNAQFGSIVGGMGIKTIHAGAVGGIQFVVPALQGFKLTTADAHVFVPLFGEVLHFEIVNVGCLFGLNAGVFRRHFVGNRRIHLRGVSFVYQKRIAFIFPFLCQERISVRFISLLNNLMFR